MGLLDRLTAEVISLKGALRTLKLTTPIAKNPTRVFPQVILDLADKYGDAPALLSDHERFTYRELAARSNRYARWALAQHLRKGDTVCLMMPGRPEFLAAWIGITRVGGVVALINTHLTGTALAYCINVVSPKHIIVAAELFDSLEGARAHIAGEGKIWVYGEPDANLPRIDRALDDDVGGDNLAAAELPALTIEDRALYIYTSGTTGLPKAANVNHYRVMLASYAFAGVMDTRPSDRMYDCLPLYHTAGGVVATGALLVNGGSVVIRDKFSAREFWDDVVRWDCTCFQYIGELCRYLVNSPPTPKEREHHLRLACGTTCGRNSSDGSKFRKSSSSMPRPKATSRCSISTARKARWAGCPGGSPRASQPRSCASIRNPSSRCGTSAVSASSAMSTSPGKSSARS
jgi:fatty-acyl-CoA synthase